MAVWFYKWLLLPFLLPFPGQGPAMPHPFHVSVTEINHNGADRSLEVSCKLFVDDFERALSEAYRTRADLINPPSRPAMDSLVRRYMLGHLGLAVNGQPRSWNYVGFEHEQESVYVYLEIPGVNALNRLDVTCGLMYDLFDDQVNILHAIRNGERKSTRVNYPDKQASFSW